MATNANGNVKLIKLALSIASVAAIAGITGRLAGDHASVGSGEGPLASAVPAPGQGIGADGGPSQDQFGSPPYGPDRWAGDWRRDRYRDWDDDWDDDDWDDDDWDDDDRDDDRDHDRNGDREGRDSAARLWFQPRDGGSTGQQAGGRPQRTRTRQS